MSEKLKACPFCGGIPEERKDFYGCIIFGCKQCGYELYPVQYNTRHDSEEIERLRKGLEDILYKSVNCDIYDLKGIAEKALSKQESHNATL